MKHLDFELRLKKLMFRAALQRYVHDRFPERMKIVRASRVRWQKSFNKCSFAEYVRGVIFSKRAALRGVISKDELESDETINMFYDNIIRPRIHQLATFLNLRCLFAPVIEALLLVDRALCLQETGRFYVEMRSLFDSRLSPRSIAILAWFKDQDVPL